MTYTRHIGALSALALTLVLGACSTPEDLTTPTLEPQFGTANDDRGVDVAFASTNQIYSLSEEAGTVDRQEEGYNYYSEYQKSVLKRYDSGGNVVWEKVTSYNECDYECTRVNPKAVYADANGYVYVLYRHHYTGEQDAYPPFTGYYLEKYSDSGYPIWGRVLGNAALHEPNVDQGSVDVVVDKAGSIYVVLEERAIRGWGNQESQNFVAKYSSSGTLLWQRTSTVGTPYGITVSSSGSVYVAGSAGYARYSSTGGLTWTKTGASDEIIVSGSNIYTRYRTTIRRHDSTGKTLWSKTQSGLSSLVVADITGDGSGNVYLAGKYSVTSTNRNAFTRKLNSSGSVVWTKPFGTSAYDDALGIATITGSEIYTTGLTRGSLGHTNIGGEDGYLRKTNSSGDRVWTR